MTTLVLWDIDLTLLDLRPLGASWFQAALTEVTGRELTDLPAFGGRTDRWIVAEFLRRVGLADSDELIARVHAAAVPIAERDQARTTELGVVLPGAAEALRAVADRADAVQSLVTGNLAQIASYKMRAFGLEGFLDLSIGGYGAVSADRADLLADAIARATAKHGRPPERVVVIGDTPHDVHAALAHQAVAVGVSTGRNPPADLWQAGAHAVLPDLADTGAVLATLLPHLPE